MPASTPLSDRISRDLKKRGFTFVGATIVYSLLQSAGLVDDHLKGCRLARQLPSAGITRNRGELRELSSVRFERRAAAFDFLLCAAY